MQVPAQIKPKRVEIGGKLRNALHAMIWDGLELVDAARNCNISAPAIRKALTKPHILAYMKAEKQMLRESLSPRNIHRLAQIRDAADNMPAVAAIRALEQMGEDEQRNAGSAHAPGITIRIINAAPQQLTQVHVGENSD